MMKRFFLLGLVFILCLSLVPMSYGQLQAPKIFNYQGQILDANNQPLNKTVPIEFKIYANEVGGSPLWVEIQDVTAVSGYVNVYLGTINPLTIKGDNQYWLEIKVGNSSPYPRTRMSSVVSSLYAIIADTAEFAQTVLPNGVNSAAIQDAAVTQTKLAPGVQAVPWGQAGGDLAGNYPNPTLRPGAVLQNIEDGSITQNKLAPNVTTPPSGPASGDLTGTYPDPQIAVGAVKTDRIADRAVTGVKIAMDAVGPYQLAPSGVYADTYGDMYHVGQFTVDEDGRITFAGNVLIEAASNTYSDIDIVMTEINDLDLQIKPNTVGDAELISTTVTPDTYGDMYHVGQFTVNQDGRLTFADDVLIMAASQTPSDVTVNVGEINNLDLQLDDDVVGVPELFAYTDNETSKPSTPFDNGRFLYYVFDNARPESMRWSSPAVDGTSPVWDAETNEFIWATPEIYTAHPIVGDGSVNDPITLNSSATFVNDWEVLFFDPTTTPSSWQASKLLNEHFFTSNDPNGQGGIVLENIGAPSGLDNQVLQLNGAGTMLEWDYLDVYHNPLQFDGTGQTMADPINIIEGGITTVEVANATLLPEDIAVGTPLTALITNAGGSAVEWGVPAGYSEAPVSGNGTMADPYTIEDGAIGLDKFAPGAQLGQMMYWDNSGTGQWLLSGDATPTSPTFTYVMKWIDNGSQGYADWAPDMVTIPFYYEGDSDGMNAFHINSTDLTGNVAVFETSGSGDALVANVPNDNSAGSAIVATGGGSDQPTVQITRTSDNAISNGALNVTTSLTTLESLSPSVVSTLTVDNDNTYNTASIWATNTVTTPSLNAMHYGGYFNVDAGANGVAVNALGNAGMAIAGESAPLDPAAYVGSIKRVGESVGRSMYIEGSSENVDMLIADPADTDNATLVVRNTLSSNSPGIDWNTAIKAYGDIWANSAIGGSWIIGWDAVVIGDPNGLHTMLTPPLVPGGSTTFSTGIWVDGDVETTGTFIGDGSGLFNIAEANTTAANEAEDAVLFYNGTDWEWTVAPTVDRTALVWENGSLTWSTIDVSFADITSGTNTSATMVVSDDAMLYPENGGIVRANEWVYDAPFSAASGTIADFWATNAWIDNIWATNIDTENLTATSATFDNALVNFNLTVGDGTGNGNLTTDYLAVLFDGFVGNDFGVGNDLTVGNSSTITNDLFVGDMLTVDGDTYLNGMLDVDGATTLNSTLDVDLATTLNSTLDVDGATTLNNTLDVDGATTLNSTLDVDLATTLNSTLDVDGATTLNNTLDVDGDANFNARVGVDNNYGTTDDVFVVGLDGEPEWTKSLENLVYVNTDDLLVDNSATITNDLFVGDMLTVDGDSYLNGMLDVDGATTLNSTLDVDLATTLNSTLDVDGATTLNNTLDVDGATTLNSTLDVDLATTLNSTLDVDGATTLNNTLDVDGATTLNSTLDVDLATTLNSTLDVDGATTLNNTLDVDGATTLNSTLDVDGATTLNSTLDVDLATTLNSTLVTAGSATFQSDVQIDNNLNVDGNVNFNGFVGVDGDNGTENDVFVVGADGEPEWTTTLDGLTLVETSDLVASSATVTTDLEANNAEFIAGGTVDFNGNVNVNGGIDFTGTFDLDGVPGTAGQVLVSDGVGNTPVWTSSLELENLTVTNEFISSGSSTLGETYFDGNVAIGDISTSFTLTINGEAVPTLGSNTFTGLNLFGYDPSADPIAPGTILAAVTNNDTDPTVSFQNVGTGPVLEIRGVEGENAFIVAEGDAIFQGATQMTLSTTTYTPDAALIVTAGTPVNDAALVVQNVQPDGIGLHIPFGGVQLAATYQEVPGGGSFDMTSDYTIYSINPGAGITPAVQFPTVNVQLGQIIYVINVSATNTLTVDGFAGLLGPGDAAMFARVEISGGGNAWKIVSFFDN